MSETNYLLPIGETIKEAWEKVKGAKGTVWAAILILFITAFCIGFITEAIENVSPVLGSILNFVGQVIISLFQIGLLYIGIQRAFDRPITYKQMFVTFKSPTLWRVIVLYILEMLIFLIPMILFFLATAFWGMTSIAAIAVGWVLFIVSSILLIFLTIRLILAMGLVVDKDYGPIEAIKASYRATCGNVCRLFSVLILQWLILLVSIIPVGIGLIWTAPLCFIIYGVFYKKLLVNIPVV